MLKRLFISLAGCAWILGMTGLAAFAAEATLQWDPNTEANLAGYRLFRSSTSLLGLTPAQAMGDNTIQKTDIANPASTTITVSGLVTKKLYYFRLTAYNISSIQSEFNVDHSGNAAEVLVYLPDSTEAKAPEKFLSPALADGKNDVAYFGTQAEEVTILDVNGRQVFHKTRAENAGAPLAWDCRDGSGKLVASGVYIVKIRRSDGKLEYQSFAIVK